MATIVNRRKADKELFVLSLVVFLFFYTMFFISVYRNDFTAIGVIIELFTLPMLAALTALGVMSIILLIKRKCSLLLICSLLLQLAVMIRFVTI